MSGKKQQCFDENCSNYKAGSQWLRVWTSGSGRSDSCGHKVVWGLFGTSRIEGSLRPEEFL